MPAATERLFEAVERNPTVALAVASCEWACSAVDGRCRVLPEPLPRARLLAESEGLLVQAPIDKLTMNDVRTMRTRMDGAATLVEDFPHRVVVEVNSRASSWLVLADTWYPGWTATVDDEETPIQQAHGVFRSLEIPGGKHRVVFTYDPLSFRIGLAATFLGTALWLGLLIVGWHRNRSKPPCGGRGSF